MIYHKHNSINGIKIIDLHPFYDDRGVLAESYKRDLLINTDFCQDNIVNSNYSCLRGLIFNQSLCSIKAYNCNKRKNTRCCYRY